MKLAIRPISLRDAAAFIRIAHRHHTAPQGCKFALAAYLGPTIVGVVVVGRPVCKEIDDGVTAEVTRLCTDGTPNACSFLYSRAARACQAMGYVKVITYIRSDETGVSLQAGGWTFEAFVKGRSWSRPRRDKTQVVDRRRYALPL